MTLNESVFNSEERIEVEQQRIKALKELREKHFEYDPAGFDFVTFTVADTRPDMGVYVVHGVKNHNAAAGWWWFKPGDEAVCAGHWNELIASITAGTLYPVGAYTARGNVTHLV